MNSHDEELGDKVLRAQVHVWNHTLSFIKATSLKCVVDLGLPEAIHTYGQPMPLSNLIASLPIHPSKTLFIHRLMRIMVHSGFFSQQNLTHKTEVEYMLTDASLLLLKNHPLSMPPFLHVTLDPSMTTPLHHFSSWFKNGDLTPFQTAHGMLFWDYAGGDRKINHLFNAAIENDARLISSLMIENCKGTFTGLESLVDVGGGTGTMAKVIAKSFPKMQCIVLDLPHVVAGLQGGENLKYVGGDMFEAIPPADAILLKWIMHDWSDEECMKYILKKCKEAITKEGKKGKVIIIEAVMDDEKRDDELVETQLVFDITMMVFLNGKERNKKEWVNLISSVGFSECKITPILGLRSLIEIYPY
ncbi:hypothetical protein VNO80_05566 [Phaseolus coccineus]|uniref:isoflavone 7-O-methyltransferase n=1 Tax=Phaseolus coccineus TaxID=3886 RepID=A0AAN9NFA8_PHACN